MTRESINNNDKKVINLLNRKGELQFADFERVLKLSVAGTKSKILDYINRGWIKIANNNQVTYSYVRSDMLPEIEE